MIDNLVGGNAPNITTLDLHFLEEAGLVACHLMRTDSECILIDTGPYSTFTALKKGLSDCGLALSDITKIFLTHIHLDHAGAAWAIMEESPNCRLYVHPYGARHLIAPERLMSSASRIYGDNMERMWSRMEPINRHRVEVIDDGQVIPLNHRNGDNVWSLRSHHTPGHATHYITWELVSTGTSGEQSLKSKALFTGDVAGIKLNDKSWSESFVWAAIPPPDLHFNDWFASLEKLRQCGAEALYIAHFGLAAKSSGEVVKHLNSMENYLKKEWVWCSAYFEDNFKKMVRVKGGSKEGKAQEISEKVVSLSSFKKAYEKFMEQEHEKMGLQSDSILAQETRREIISPTEMSFLGLVRYFKKYEKIIFD